MQLSDMHGAERVNIIFSLSFEDLMKPDKSTVVHKRNLRYWLWKYLNSKTIWPKV